MDYITNIMKFIEAILSNNSTDDHCKEFVKQKGLVPLLEILSLPNLPIDFPSSTACQSVAQVCKAILHLARDPQVIDESLNSLARALNKCEQYYKKYVDNYHTKNANSSKKPMEANVSSRPLIDGSVLIAELASSDNPLDACNQPLQTPLLHSISHVHSIIYLLITLGKINQNDVRHLTIGKWGSPDLGVKCLRDLSKLYMSLIWESSMLLWLCNEEQQTAQLHQLVAIQQLQQAHLSQLIAAQPPGHAHSDDLMTQTTILSQLNQLIQQLNAVNSSSSSANVFEYNRADLERIKQCLMPPSAVLANPLVVHQQSSIDSDTASGETGQQSAFFNVDNQSEKMDVSTSAETSTMVPPAVPAQVNFLSSTVKMTNILCDFFIVIF